MGRKRTLRLLTLYVAKAEDREVRLLDLLDELGVPITTGRRLVDEFEGLALFTIRSRDYASAVVDLDLACIPGKIPMMPLILAAIGLAGLNRSMVVAGAAVTHPGGPNAEGCHNNRRTGDYHCHGGAQTRAPSTPSRALSGGAFRNCAAARAAGAAPVRRGDPGYGPHLDADGDGIGCEPYRRR